MAALPMVYLANDALLAATQTTCSYQSSLVTLVAMDVGPCTSAEALVATAQRRLSPPCIPTCPAWPPAGGRLRLRTMASCHRGRPLPCAGRLCTLQWPPVTCLQLKGGSIWDTPTVPAQGPQVATRRIDQAHRSPLTCCACTLPTPLPAGCIAANAHSWQGGDPQRG